MNSNSKRAIPKSIRIIEAGVALGILGSIAGILTYSVFLNDHSSSIWLSVMFAGYLILYVGSLIGIIGKKAWARKALLAIFSIGLLTSTYSFIRVLFYWEGASVSVAGFKIFGLVYAAGLFTLILLPQSKRYLERMEKGNT